jgi:hypothetical protein
MQNVVDAMKTMTNQTKFSDLQESLKGVFETLANSLIVIYLCC